MLGKPFYLFGDLKSNNTASCLLANANKEDDFKVACPEYPVRSNKHALVVGVLDRGAGKLEEAVPPFAVASEEVHSRNRFCHFCRISVVGARREKSSFSSPGFQ